MASKSVFVAVPCQDSVHTVFMRSLFLAFNLLSANRITYAFSTVQGSGITKSRNKAVKEFLASGLDYLMFFDSDMQFPPETIVELMKHDKDVIGCTYPRRSSPHYLNHVEMDGSEGKLGDGMREVRSIATGCLLIRRKVLESMAYPWFQFVYDGAIQDEWGEDYSFCKESQKHGFKVWLDAELSKKIGHVGAYCYQAGNMLK